MSTAKELPKTYEPKETEERLYRFWEKGGFFHAEIDKSKTPYTIVLPPPNVTGQLHMGHAFDHTLQDVLIRTKRMQGYSTLWLPGTDHAGIATQIKVEEVLRGEGLSRYDLGREKFLERVWEWKNKYGGRIIEQLKRMGASCDWDRLRFTMDEGCSHAVKEVFVNLYNKGLIYKGSRIINWCPKCTTALSDAEVEYSEKPGHLWHVRYPIEDSDEYIVIATTRPETMLGDSGIAVHPEDERYSHLVGKHAVLPLVGRRIPIFADEYVEREFGTGCVKVTPCHDPNDFEMGQRHGLEFILVMDGEARINENGGKYQGLERDEARRAILADLAAEGYLVREEEHVHNVGAGYRCGTTVEPMTSAQWFVKMKPLAEEALRVVNDGEIRFVPDRFSKIYTNWMENVRDWCISRQLWWGHLIPAWYCDDCGHMTVSKDEVCKCEKCGSANIRQDEDVLDTWFSSALWPFSTLGWPEKTPELEYFYPTNVLVTAYDIIFFWVARMVFSGMEHMKERPFRDVFIHGIVRDAQGRKMSKSLGNGIDPLDVVDKYGADALRFALVTGNGPGNDIRFSYERVENSRNFCNKIWNASRFVMMNLTVSDFTLPEQLDLEDRWILSRLNTVTREVTENIEKYELGIAAEKLNSFIWDNYCDWYIELCKTRLTDREDTAASERAQRVLGYVLDKFLRLLHPFMPFVTESIWQALPHEGESIMVAEWPKYDERLAFPREEADMERIMQAIRAVRTRRSEMNVPPSKRAALLIVSDMPELFRDNAAFFKRLAWADDVSVSAQAPADAGKMISCVTEAAKIYMPLSDLVDTEKELQRLNKERDNALRQIQSISGKLANESFVAKAPEAVVNAEREKLAKFEELLRKLDESIAALA
ncbi:MAG: valine--tRNA ligase [Clostridia bacterium]|nr:valine--tRNA ligase [Clostridia bacterium]